MGNEQLEPFESEHLEKLRKAVDEYQAKGQQESLSTARRDLQKYVNELSAKGDTIWYDKVRSFKQVVWDSCRMRQQKHSPAH